MTYESDFSKLFDVSFKMWDCSGSSEFAARQVEALFGRPGTLNHVEATLVGTALVNPSDPDVRWALSQVEASSLRYARYREIWEGCKGASTLDSEAGPEECLKRVAHQIWRAWGRPINQMPESACHAISLSGQFISTAGIRALVRQYQELRSEMDLRRRILEISAEFRSEGMSAKACLDRLCALRDQVAVYGI